MRSATPTAEARRRARSCGCEIIRSAAAAGGRSSSRSWSDSTRRGWRRIVSPDEIRIWTLIAERQGRANAIGVHDLAAATLLNERVVRKIVKALIEDHGCPIASSPHPPPGYFIPEELPEILATLESLKGRALSILVRMSRLKRTTLRETVNQLELELHEDAA